MKLNFAQTLFKIGFVNDLPFFSFNPTNPNESYGMDGKLFKTLSNHFNFTIQYVACQSFGIQNILGNWSGIVGKIIEEEIDFGVGGVVMNHERILVIPFLDTYWMDRLAFAIRKQQPHLDFDILLRPFELDVWLCLLATFLLFFIFDNLMNRLFPPKSSLPTGHQIDSLDNLCWIDFCLLCRQPYPWLARLRLSTKICTIIFIFSISVLSNNYGGGLCSLLAVPASVSIDNIDKLADACRSHRIIPLSLDAGYFQKMKDTNIYSFREISQTIQSAKNREEAIMKILNNSGSEQQQYAFLYPRERLRFSQLRAGKDLLYVSPDTEEASFFPLHISIPTRPTFKYRKEFSRIIQQIQFAGLLKRWRNLEIIRITLKKTNQNTLEPESDSLTENKIKVIKKFNLQNLQSIFYVYFIWMSIAVISLIMEISVRYLSIFMILS
uniref:Glutamate receptor-like n=1 Tax=Dermatophagoides pteronyssinus TaxID=6956 RepID=A0A6P6Y4I0_DERPT|nr:glutamate receptor-like [Dermatophagoides pteronyssinus]